MEALTEILDRHLRRTPGLFLVLNTNAGRVRRHMASPSARATAEATPRLHLTSSLSELDELFEELQIDRSQTVCFYGGDGSIARGLSAMINRFGEDAPLPTVLPVAAGTINVMSEYLGLAEPPAETLARLREHGLVRRALPSIKIAVDGHAPLYGFMFGWGVSYRVLESYYVRRPHPTLADATVVMAQTFAQSLHPRATQLPLFLCRDLRLQVDGESLGPAQPSLHSLVVGVLSRSTMGLRPLPPGERRFHISGNGMKPAMVFRHSPSLLLGARRPAGARRRAPGGLEGQRVRAAARAERGLHPRRRDDRDRGDARVHDFGRTDDRVLGRACPRVRDHVTLSGL